MTLAQVDDAAALGEQRDHRAVDQPRGARRDRQGDDEEVGERQHLRHVLRAHDAIEAGDLAPAGVDADRAHAVALGLARHRLAERAGARDHRGLALDRRGEDRLPGASRLRAHEALQRVVEHHHAGEAELAALGRVQARGVGEHEAAVEPGGELLHARVDRLDPAQPRRIGAQRGRVEADAKHDLRRGERLAVRAEDDAHAREGVGMAARGGTHPRRRDGMRRARIRDIGDIDDRALLGLGHGRSSPWFLSGVQSR
jgi:hypothetical protein